MYDTKRWYSWVIKRNRYDNVITHVRENVSEVDRYFYPVVKQEYKTKKGSKIKERPLYEGYIFLHYNDPDVVYHKLNASPFVTTFAGTIEDSEIVAMEAVQGKLLTDLETSRFSKGDIVMLLEGPFKGFEAVVQESKAGKVQIRVDAKLLGQNGIELVFSEDLVERKSEEPSTGVQNI